MENIETSPNLTAANLEFGNAAQKANSAKPNSAKLWVAALLTASLIFSFIMLLNSPILNTVAGQTLLSVLAFLTMALFAVSAFKAQGETFAFIFSIISALILNICFFGLSGPAIACALWPALMQLHSRKKPRTTIIATLLIILSAWLTAPLSELIWASFASFGQGFTIAISLVFGVALSLLLPAALSKTYRGNNIDFEKLRIAQAEAEKLNQQSNERTRFIAEMSHEIRTPLNAILGFSDTMREGVFGPLNPQYHEYSELIHQSGTHLLDLVGDLLDMSKIEAGKYILAQNLIDVQKIAREIVNIYSGAANRSGIKISIIGPQNMFIKGDERALRQILLNIISNSIKFTPNNGTISVHGFQDSAKVWLEVSDNGRGMSEDELARIGQPYMSSDDAPPGARGTGLGLALVRRLTQMQNGNFEISSKLNHGTTVTLEFMRA